MFVVEEEVLPLTSRSIAGVCPLEESIPVWFEEDTVGNAEAVKLDIVEGLREEKRNLFAIFPIGAAIQDGGKRKSVILLNMLPNEIMPNINMLSTRITNRVMNKDNTTLIISIDNCCSSLSKIKFFK